MTELSLCQTPNQHARPCRMESSKDGIYFYGYQEFFLSPNSMQVFDSDLQTQTKQKLLEQFFKSRIFDNRDFLDLGANSGFFTFWALQSGATRATAIDIDDVYIKMMREASNLLDLKNLQVIKSNIADWKDSSDIVGALAIVHWIYSCTAFFGSLNQVLKKLASLTNHILFVEWVEPTDPAIQFFKHNEYNKDFLHEPYNRQNFEAALAQHFKRYKNLGSVSSTRSIYVASKTDVLSIDPAQK